jgi:hypothetical protein
MPAQNYWIFKGEYFVFLMQILFFCESQWFLSRYICLISKRGFKRHFYLQYETVPKSLTLHVLKSELHELGQSVCLQRISIFP